MSLVTATEALDGEKRLESRAFDHVCKTTVDTFRTTGNNVNLHDQIITSTKPHIVSLQRIRTKKPLALVFPLSVRTRIDCRSNKTTHSKYCWFVVVTDNSLRRYPKEKTCVAESTLRVNASTILSRRDHQGSWELGNEI